MESIGFSTSDLLGLLGLKCCCSNSDGCSNVLSFGFSGPNKSRRPFCRSQESLRPPFFFCRSDNCFRCTFGITSNVVCNKEAIESFRIKCICLGQRIKLSNTTQIKSGQAMAITTTWVKTRNNATMLDGIMRCANNHGSKRSNFHPILVAKCYSQETELK